MKKKYRHSINLYHIIANPIKRFYWFFSRPEFCGVKSLIQHKDTFLFIRNTYGTKRWTFPGGGVNRNEELAEAMKRETLEEVGIVLSDYTYIGFYNNTLYHRKGTVHCYHAKVDSSTLDIDPQEIEDAVWFKLDEMPKNKFASVDNVLDLYNNHHEFK